MKRTGKEITEKNTQGAMVGDEVAQSPKSGLIRDLSLVLFCLRDGRSTF